MLQYRYHMLANKHRFHGPNSLRYVYRQGQTVHSHFFKVKFAPNTQMEHTRFAVVVSKKVHKSAVGRNRIRRRVYGVIRSQLPIVKPGVDVVIMIVSGEVMALPSTELRRSLVQLFSEANLYE